MVLVRPLAVDCTHAAKGNIDEELEYSRAWAEGGAIVSSEALRALTSLRSSGVTAMHCLQSEA